MKNWRKGGMILLLCIALSGCKALNCGCPMSRVEGKGLTVDGCSLAAAPSDKASTNNHQPATN